MALPIWLCGAVPFDPLMDPAARGESVNRVLMCCHCHVMESMALLERFEERHPPDPDIRLPDVVPRDKMTQDEEPDSPFKDIIYSPTTEDKSAANWRQVGQDLRRIADQFQSMKQQPGVGNKSTTAGSWIQTCLVHGLVAYVGWRIQRWVSG